MAVQKSRLNEAWAWGCRRTVLATALLLGAGWPPCAAQWEGREELLGKVERAFGSPVGATRLSPRERVWVDRQQHRVIVDGYIALQEGQLEMLACPVFTKEHEAVVALFCRAATVHAGLLAAGAEVGQPVRWEPTYAPPSGSEIQVLALWTDPEGKRQKIDARKWVRQLNGTQRHLEPNWVFAGSSFWEDPDTGRKHYQAESGDLICVSNFSTATLDVPLKSTDANAGLMFVADTSRIPPRGTPIRLVLQVVQPQAAAEPADPSPPVREPSPRDNARPPLRPAEPPGDPASPDRWPSTWQACRAAITSP